MKTLYIDDFFTFIKKINSKITNNTKLAFYSAIIMTFITHITFFIERWLNEDDFRYIIGEATNIGLGRWMNSSIFSSQYLIPIVLLVLTMISLGICSVLINSMFKIKSKFFIFIISALLSTFPVLALGFGYLFMVERFVLGLLSGILAVYFTDKYKKGFILGSIFLAMSLGYYQSYISVAIGLSIFLILIKGFSNIEVKKYVNYILKFLIMGILGLIFYFILTKLSCYISGISLYEYKGINKIGTFPPLNRIPILLKRTYGNFLAFFIGQRFLKPLNYGLCAQILLSIINIILLVLVIVRNKLYKNIPKFIIIIMLTIILPFGLNIIDFIAYESHISSLNMYQFVFILISPFILFNYIFNIDNSKITNSFNAILSWVLCLSAIVLIWNNFIITNIYYLKINNFYTYTVQLTNRIYDRIENTEGFNHETKVLIGNFNGIYTDLRTNNTFSEIFKYDQGLWHQFIGYYPVSIQSDYKFHMLVSNVLGINLKYVLSGEYEKIYNSQEYKDMPSWPHKDSVKFIDDILVVKIS